MASTDKNIVINPSRGLTETNPNIEFSGANATLSAQTITLDVLPTTGGQITFRAQDGNILSIFGNLQESLLVNVAANFVGNVKAGLFIGNGSGLSSLTGANVTGTVPSATIAETVTTAAQPNITSVGVLSSLAVTGNVTAGNANLGNLVVANYFSGNGSLLTSLPAGSQLINGNSNIVVNANSNITMATNGAEALRITTAQRIGIGTNDPQALLDVSGGDSFFGTTTNTATSIVLRRNGATVGSIGTYNSQLELSGGANLGAGHLAVTSSGNVGINITSPQARLHVVGTANITGAVTLGDTLTVIANANVGNIGATNANLSAATVAGNLDTANLSVTGTSNLNNVSNVVILGGSNNKFLQTNGSGTLSWDFPGTADNVLYVSKSGNDANGGTSLDDAKLTIAAAVTVANGLQSSNPTGTTVIFVKAGDYTEVNPISLSAGVSIVGDNLRTVTVRPSNRTKDIFWVRNRCYVTGMTFRDHLYPSAAVAFPDRTFTGSISGTTLAVTAISSPITDIRVGMYVTGTGVAANTYITALGTGTGGTGTYIVNNSQSVGSTSMKGAEYIVTSPYTQNASSITTKSLITAGSFVVGYTYKIQTIGTTDYTLIGAASNTVGIEFTATGVGAGTGTAYTVVGCGMRVDGDFAIGLKSMVLDSYTQFNSGGLGIHILNMGYAQLVSIFTICCTAGVKCESGGTCSIANSNNAFGDYGLWSDGASPALYTGNLLSNTRSTITLDSLSQRPAVNDAVLVTDGVNTQYLLVRESTPLVSGSSTITFVETLNFTPNTGTVSFYQISLIAASSQTFEYVGTGTDILTSTPRLGGVPIQANEIRETNGGRVNYTSTDQFGDFRIGNGLLISEEAGVIEGTTFDKSLFAVLTPYILALEG